MAYWDISLAVRISTEKRYGATYPGPPLIQLLLVFLHGLLHASILFPLPYQHHFLNVLLHFTFFFLLVLLVSLLKLFFSRVCQINNANQFGHENLINASFLAALLEHCIGDSSLTISEKFANFILSIFAEMIDYILFLYFCHLVSLRELFDYGHDLNHGVTSWIPLRATLFLVLFSRL